MKVEVTQKGIYDQDGKRIPIGAEIDVKGDHLPGAFVNKVRILSGGSKGKVAVTNPASGSLPGEMTAESVLAMAEGNFMAFKAAAKSILGDNTPAKKGEIVAMLEELATAPE